MTHCLNDRDAHSGKRNRPQRILRAAILAIPALIAFSVSLAFCPNPAYSQTAQAVPQLYAVSDQTQTPIPGAGHDYQHLLNETVNLSNGSVSFKISFPVPQGRGLTLPLAWSYNSAAVSPLDATDGLTPTWDDPAMHFWPMRDGWNLAEGFPQATVQLFSVSPVAPGEIVVPCNYQSGMTFTDMSGVTHNLGTGAQSTSEIISSGGSVSTCGNSQVTLPPFGDGQVVATPNPTTGSVSLYSSNPSNGSFVVVDKNGTIYNFGGGNANLPSSPNASIAAELIEDRNGNEITGLDTRGQPLQGPNGGPSNSPFTIDGLTYTPSWDQYPWSYNGSAQISPPASGVLCGGGKSFPTGAIGTRYGLTSLTLPNNQTFYFSYWNDGKLSQITYPDGGWIRYTWQNPSGFNEMISMSSQQQTGLSGEDQPIYSVFPNGCVWQYQTPVLATRQVSFDGTTVAQTQSFVFNTNWSYTNGVVNGWTSKTATVTTTDNKVGALASAPSTTVYTYLPYGSITQPFVNGYNAQSIPLESTIVYYDWGKSTPVKTVTKTWVDQFNMASETTVNAANQVAATYYTYGYGCSGSQLNTETRFTYLLEQDDWDFGLLSPPTAPPTAPPTVNPTKRTIYNYTCLGNTNIPSYSLYTVPSNTQAFPGLALPPKISSVVIENGAGTIQSATRYQYDGAQLTPVSPAPTQVDANFANVTVRGNLTSVARCYPAPTSMSAVATCSGPTSSYTYDITGQPSSMIDACGNSSCSDISGSNHTTYYSFADNPVGGNSAGNSNAYLTKITYPMTAAGVTLKKSFQYNYPLGYLVESIDENSQPTTYTYNDSMNRLTQITYPQPSGGQTSISYTDVAPSPTITTSKELNTSPLWETSVATMDGMEHVVETQLTTDPGGADTVLTTYSGEGQVYTKTNPFRGTSAPANTTTTYYYDALGRPIETLQQDSSTLQWCYDGAVSVPAVGNCSAHLGANLTQVGSLTGTWVDSTDENGNHWQRSSDAFGRLTQVMEPNGSAQSPTMETDYNYSYLSDLLSVKQWGGASGASGARTRSFSYDNLSRLGSSANPETGTIGYVYDANNNLQSKTDARGVTTSYIYDTLNRLLSKTYSNDASSTPFSCYQYDLGTNGLGRLSNAWTQRASGTPSCPASSFLTERSILAYDQMGRPTSAQQQQCVGSQCSAPTSYSLTMAYDLIGNMQTLINPVGASGQPLTLTHYFDGASRPCLTTSSWSGNFPANLFQTNPSTSGSTTGYTSFGSLQNWYMGSSSSTASTSCGSTPASSINVTQGYTNRLWVNSIAATGQIP